MDPPTAKSGKIPPPRNLDVQRGRLASGTRNVVLDSAVEVDVKTVQTTPRSATAGEAIRSSSLEQQLRISSQG